MKRNHPSIEYSSSNPNLGQHIQGLIEKDIPHRVKAMLSRVYIISEMTNRGFVDGDFISTAGEFATNIASRMLLEFIGIKGVNKRNDPQNKISDIKKRINKDQYEDTEFLISDIKISEQECQRLDIDALDQKSRNKIIEFFNLASKNTAHLTILLDLSENQDSIYFVIDLILNHLEQEIYAKTDLNLYEQLGLNEGDYKKLQDLIRGQIN